MVPIKKKNTPLDAQVVADLAAMQYWITDVSDENHEWRYVNTPSDPDVVIAIADLSLPPLPESVNVTALSMVVSQWLGHGAAAGDVRYSVRYKGFGGLLAWYKDPLYAADVKLVSLTSGYEHKEGYRPC